MLTNRQKIIAIDLFSIDYLKECCNMSFDMPDFPECYKIDRWLLLDVYRILHEYKKEL
jgi:hypothetical protein